MILVRIALRNLISHKVKSLIVGGLLVFGTILVILGQSLLASLDRSMAASIVNSIAGHAQIYSEKAKDKLSLFGSFEGNEIGQISNFPQIRLALEALPEVESVIPMGIDNAMVFGGNLLDIKMEQLRAAYKGGDKQRQVDLRNHLRRIIQLMSTELKNMDDIADKAKFSPEYNQGLLDVAKAGEQKFWDDFDRDPLTAMEFLENKIAPMQMAGDMLFFRYIGTDTARYAKGFDRFEMAEGTPVPPGQRGMLFNWLTYQDMIKHKTARRLDKIKDKRADGAKFGHDDDLETWTKLNKSQYKDITYQLDDPSAALVRTALQTELKSKEKSLDKLVQAFMDLTDENFAQRYKVFYDAIAPHLMLYSVRIGDTITLKGFAQSGYQTSVNVKVYGTFRFRSLDKSTLAGSANILDMMTFRDLYGFLTADRKAELSRLQKASGVKEIARDKAEDELFGAGDEEVAADVGAQDATPTTVLPFAPTAVALAAGASPTVVAAAPPPAAEGKGFDEFKRFDMKDNAKDYRKDLGKVVYTQEEIDGGIVRNAAIMFKAGVDPKLGMQSVTVAIAKNKLGVQLVDWRTASGMIGDFVMVIYIVLATAILVIFIVALVIINNSTVMATMERVREIGTMRAIGAQKIEILRMFMVEALVLGAIFGAIGSLLGSALMLWLGHKGIPAVNDMMIFLFAGPRLHPFLSVTHVLVAVALVFFVTTISTLYPAWLATRVTPLEAMQEAE